MEEETKIKNFQAVIARYYMESLRQLRRPSCWRQDERQRITENTAGAAQVHHSSRRVFGDLVLRGLWTLCSVL